MEENKQRNSKRRLNSLILLVAFTAIMLIISTYAWFSAQRNVSISNLEGTVKVVEGLEISLDALHWSQEIDLTAAGQAGSAYLDTGKSLESPYDGGANVIPSEMIPVSGTGISGEGIGASKIKLYRGINVNGIDLYNIEETDETVTDATDNQFPGYYAIDFFLKNTSADGAVTDPLQLNLNSELRLKDSQLDTTGLQNTTRIAFALYNSKNTVGTMASQSDILTATTGDEATIKDVAIWEPNSNAHADYIVTNNNRITWTSDDATEYLGNASETKFAKDKKIPTYALTATSVASTAQVQVDPLTQKAGILNIYDWKNTTDSKSGLTKQMVQATVSGPLGQATDLLSVKDSTGHGKDEEKPFLIPANDICRLRMYVWLEGQDVDTINLASHGGGVHLDLGIVKPGSDTPDEDSGT